jgi:mannose-6-phosphate isomerase-like protein (cupin superfamily)
VVYGVAQIDSKAGQSYITNIIKETEDNTFFRKVLFTGTRSQLVIMSIPPGGEVGTETHTYTEQTLFFLSGTGEAVLDGKTSLISGGDVVVVTPGTEHNFINTGTVPLKIYTVYAPPNHIDGTTEATKADEDANVQDETYGIQPK